MRLLLAFAIATPLFAQEIHTVPVATGISAPTDIQNAADGSGRIFLVQQNGLIRLLKNGTVQSTPFLDIRSKTRADSERGLLGLAFPPAYAQSGRFYIDYTDLNGDIIVARYRATANPDVADASSEIVLLRIPHPASNHNGGQIRFGPDGYLYIGTGDGGSAGDPPGNGQNLNVLLGKILRVDPENDPGQLRVPSDNPFVDRSEARREIWAYGLRNPWRFSFDRVTGDLWIADVGQDIYEEVNYQPASGRGGANYGWNLMEGMHCFQAGCNTAGLTLPVAEYEHIEGACSITGGFLYRGNLLPGLRGMYVYGDFCNGRVWGLERSGTAWTSRDLLASGFKITTFGEDEAGEIYLADSNTGTIYRLEGSYPPRFTADAVVNAASFVKGIVAGSFDTAFAAGVRDAAGSLAADSLPLPMSLGGVSITVDGIAARIYSLSNVNGQEQVNFQTPWAIAGRTHAALVITRDGQASAPADLAVLAVQPAVYTIDGTQAAVVHNATYTLVTPSSPLVRNEYAFVYASGLGPVSNQPADGEAGPLSPLAVVPGEVRVTIGGVPCEVQFAGLAPGITGVYQVNFRVPPNANPGSQDLVINLGGASSPAVKAPVR